MASLDGLLGLTRGCRFGRGAAARCFWHSASTQSWAQPRKQACSRQPGAHALVHGTRCRRSRLAQGPTSSCAVSAGVGGCAEAGGRAGHAVALGGRHPARSTHAALRQPGLPRLVCKDGGRGAAGGLRCWVGARVGCVGCRCINRLKRCCSACCIGVVPLQVLRSCHCCLRGARHFQPALRCLLPRGAFHS